ncbi:3-oxoacyl-[acyl-carrier-protein] synthase, KASIII [[Actinomadura] parvosata subsp. kistnae]|uniref:3-oxoacyl-ACP synthase n=1 Tax=[Actinomadura] parvosata subsp. kistnae TaxID=1909395 RepID=A0A1V0A0J1_9ACTN|nr:ketoacyl-ACP synthase III family protein [Nonomuraea sp. ATCC 55076]AQZ63725.1 3-oxoacyl-ACP synthase [Nonomuraea sp. ATCC 55076]SPL89528.1 3-oxoacyl-[acyl-carrier-protein] synthase, KASIII [Actinomadura parvosata subsp. kistnae]
MRYADTYISGVGTFVPRTIVSVEKAVAKGWYPAEDAELHNLAGAAVAGETPAPEMALHAARAALKRAGRAPGDLDLLLYASTWHQGPDGWPPHSYLQRHLVGGNVLATEIRQGCNGMFIALELAAGHLSSAPGKQAALLVAADNYGTPLMDRWRMGPGYVGGDAAAALVLTRDQGFARLLSVRTTTVAEAEELHRGSEPLFPPGVTVGRRMSFTARNEQFRRDVMPSGDATAALFHIQRALVEVVEGLLDESGITAADLTRVAFMNYSEEIVEQRCMALLDLPMSRSTWDYGRTIGHCGASDQVLSLDHLLATGQLRPGDHLLMLGTGPGVTVSGAVITITDTPQWI